MSDLCNTTYCVACDISRANEQYVVVKQPQQQASECCSSRVLLECRWVLLLGSLPAAFRLRIAVCDPTLPLLQLCSTQCANRSNWQRTMRMWKIRAVRSVPVFVVAVIMGLCTYLPQCVAGIFFSVPIIPVSICTSSRVQASCTAAFVQNIQLLTAVCLALLIDRFY